MRISDWSSDVCSSDLPKVVEGVGGLKLRGARTRAPSVSASRRHLPTSGEDRYGRSPLQSSRHALGCALRRSEEHTSELQSLMRISYAAFCLKKKKYRTKTTHSKQNSRYTHVKLK